MSQISDSIFLLGPATQQYLFVTKNARRQFIEEDENAEKRASRHWSERSDGAAVSYAKEVRRAATDLPGFFPYDWLSVNPLIKLFRQARDRDFASAVKSGSYANNYTAMLAEVNQLLRNKRVQPMPDLTGLHFTVSMPGTENEVTVGIEDLSRGELKRLMIYAWLKSSQAGEAVVLIDEIETSFHPDWQAGVVRDLWDWAPQNQYLLATHSYEVCEALPPAQVLELHPWRGESGERLSNVKGS